MGDVRRARRSDEMRCFDPGVDVATIVLSHVDGVETRVALASVSRTWRNAARLPESRPARYDSMLLRVLRESCPALKAEWPESQAPEEWEGVGMEDDRVVRLDFSRTLRPLLAVPAVIGQFTSLRALDLSANQLTNVPAEIWQLTSLKRLILSCNQLTSLPAEIGQLTSLTLLDLYNNNLTSLPAEIGQLASLKRFYFSQQQADERPGLDNKRAESEGMRRVDLGLTRLFNSSQLVRPATKQSVLVRRPAPVVLRLRYPIHDPGVDPPPVR